MLVGLYVLPCQQVEPFCRLTDTLAGSAVRALTNESVMRCSTRHDKKKCCLTVIIQRQT